MNEIDGALIDSQRLAESEVVGKLLKKWEGYKNLKRVRGFVALDGEREYQEDKFPGVEPLAGELILLRVYLEKAEATFVFTHGDPKEKSTMDIIREIGGICLRCMENHGSVERIK